MYDAIDTEDGYVSVMESWEKPGRVALYVYNEEGTYHKAIVRLTKNEVRRLRRDLLAALRGVEVWEQKRVEL